MFKFEANNMGGTWVTQHANVHAKTGYEVGFETEAEAALFAYNANAENAEATMGLTMECGEAFG